MGDEHYVYVCTVCKCVCAIMCVCVRIVSDLNRDFSRERKKITFLLFVAIETAVQTVLRLIIWWFLLCSPNMIWFGWNVLLCIAGGRPKIHKFKPMNRWEVERIRLNETKKNDMRSLFASFRVTSMNENNFCVRFGYRQCVLEYVTFVSFFFFLFTRWRFHFRR